MECIHQASKLVKAYGIVSLKAKSKVSPLLRSRSSTESLYLEYGLHFKPFLRYVLLENIVIWPPITKYHSPAERVVSLLF
jgi:hypothetical protein